MNKQKHPTNQYTEDSKFTRSLWIPSLWVFGWLVLAGYKYLQIEWGLFG